MSTHIAWPERVFAAAVLATAVFLLPQRPAEQASQNPNSPDILKNMAAQEVHAQVKSGVPKPKILKKMRERQVDIFQALTQKPGVNEENKLAREQAFRLGCIQQLETGKPNHAHCFSEDEMQALNDTGLSDGP